MTSLSPLLTPNEVTVRMLLIIQDLPDDLWIELDRYTLKAREQSGSTTITIPAIVTYLRHMYTNYDGLLKKIHLDEFEVARFRAYVNHVAHEAFETWRKSHQQSTH